MAGPDFLGMGRTQRILMDADKYSMLIAHNRAATMGQRHNWNAHPFQFDHITLTHNGHVSNAMTLLPAGKKINHDVDSAHVAAAMAALGEKETLEACTGGFAFVWHNSKDGTLNIARNSGRPLKLAYVAGENTLWWMSERLMLRSILERHQITIDKEMLNLPEKVWVKFNVKNLREYTTVPFVPRSTGTTRSGATTVAGGQAQTVGQPSHTKEQTKISTTIGTKAAMAQGAKISEIQQDLIKDILKGIKVPKAEQDKRVFELSKNSCRPKGHKKVRRATERLATSGFSYDQCVLVDTRMWSKYRNQDNMGQIVGTIFNSSAPVHMSSMTLEQYKDMSDLGVLLGRVVGLKPDKKTGKQALIVEPHPLYVEFDAEWSKRYDEFKTREPPKAGYPRPILALPTGTVSGNDGKSGDVDSSGDGSPSLTHCGPGNRAISILRFNELTKNGCGCCSGDIGNSVEESKRIMWINDSPICPMCHTDPATMAGYGFTGSIPASVLPTKGNLH